MLLFRLRIILGGPKKFIGANTKISCKHIWNVKKKKKIKGKKKRKRKRKRKKKSEGPWPLMVHE